MSTPARSVDLQVPEVIDMGDVAVTIQVMPEDNEVDLERIKKEAKEAVDPRSLEEEDIAFGLKAINVVKVIPEDGGGPDELEEKLEKIEGVKGVKVTDQRKLL